METQLQTCYLTKKGPELITLFGYATKSVPGLEINGLGKYGRSIREKIIFVTRSKQLKIPIKRFVLNIEMTDELGELEGSSVKWLEYPLLIHYWYLAGLLPISKLDNCFAAGALNPSGVVEELFDPTIQNLCTIHKLHMISSVCDGHNIDSRELLSGFVELTYKSMTEAS